MEAVGKSESPEAISKGRAVANRDCTIQVLINGHRPGHRMAPAAFVNLPCGMVAKR